MKIHDFKAKTNVFNDISVKKRKCRGEHVIFYKLCRMDFFSSLHFIVCETEFNFIIDNCMIDWGHGWNKFVADSWIPMKYNTTLQKFKFTSILKGFCHYTPNYLFILASFLVYLLSLTLYQNIQDGCVIDIYKLFFLKIFWWHAVNARLLILAFKLFFLTNSENLM